MKHLLILMTLLLALVGAGCSTIRQNETQYQIFGQAGQRGVRLPVTATDQAAVKEIVTAFAQQWRLHDRTTTGSFMPTIIAYFNQDWNETAYPLTLMAFEHHGKIVIDMSQNSPDPGESPAYRARKEALLAALNERFGDRVVLPRLMDYVRNVSGQTK